MLFSRSTCQSVSELKSYVKPQVQLYFYEKCTSLLWNAREFFFEWKLSFYFRNIRSFKPGVQCSVHIFLELALLVSEPRNVLCDIPPFEPSVRSKIILCPQFQFCKYKKNLCVNPFIVCYILLEFLFNSYYC